MPKVLEVGRLSMPPSPSVRSAQVSKIQNLMIYCFFVGNAITVAPKNRALARKAGGISRVGFYYLDKR